MNIEDIIAEYGVVELSQLPEEVQAKLNAEPEALAQFQGQRDVALMLGLKQYEQQAPEVDQRIRDQVRGRIEKGDFPADEVIQGPSNWMRRSAIGLAAAATVMVSFSFFPSDDPVAVPTVAEAAPVRDQPQVPEAALVKSDMEIVHVDAFRSVATADEEISMEVLAKMEESALAHSLSLRSETNQLKDRFQLPSMKGGLTPVSLPQTDSGLIPVYDGPPQ